MEIKNEFENENSTAYKIHGYWVCVCVRVFCSMQQSMGNGNNRLQKATLSRQFHSSQPTYLTPIIPLGIHIIINDLRPELLCAHIDNGVRIRFALAEHTDVLLHQILCFHDVYTQQTLY